MRPSATTNCIESWELDCSPCKRFVVQEAHDHEPTCDIRSVNSGCPHPSHRPPAAGDRQRLPHCRHRCGRRSADCPSLSLTQRIAQVAGPSGRSYIMSPDSHINAYIRLKLALTEDNPTINRTIRTSSRCWRTNGCRSTCRCPCSTRCTPDGQPCCARWRPINSARPLVHPEIGSITSITWYTLQVALTPSRRAHHTSS